ncbi:hypothetical protein [Acidocella sp.]|uniref:hypothetical protein n=1 Tax=Acidocella sp. TaxID=50710 RepID=UPI00262682FE|nr:hypothetical protein [Acidocella sp.]
MNTKEFSNLTAHTSQDPPHRAMSRAPADYNIAVILLGCVAAAAVLALLWTLYAFG